MSKKDRLKKQSQKQLEQRRAAERSEEQERRSAGESRSAKKLRKKARRYDTAAALIIKVLMCIPFLWSGLYYGGIFVLGITMGQMDDVPSRIAAFIGIGAALCLAGLVFAFLSKYYVQFGLVLAGVIVYMQGAVYIIDKAKERIGEGYGLTEEQKNLAAKWRWGLYPIISMAVLSALLLLIVAVKKLLVRRRLRREHDNAPVKSIVE